MVQFNNIDSKKSFYLLSTFLYVNYKNQMLHIKKVITGTETLNHI